ncbi:methyltransferase domain-containing protein [Mesorhizobium sp. B2-5-4]|nr:methyltransferase domain-containing protein [Mesorhizobium sp. B2-5-4]
MSAAGSKSAQRRMAIRSVIEGCMADGVCAEAVVARLALHLGMEIRVAELAEIVLEVVPSNSQETERLQEVAGLLRRKPGAFATLRATGAAVRHARDDDETDAAVVRRLALSFDAAAAISQTASVQLASLGDEEKLSATTEEVAAWLKEQDFTGTGRDILDIGCGIGRFERALAKSFNRMVGIDISSRMISVASDRCAALGNVELRQTCGLDLTEFDDSSFDCVLAVDSFPYLVLAGMAERHFDEIARILKRPGWLALLNYSYRGSLFLDRADIGRLAEAHQLRVVINGEKPFRSWDGDAFLLARDGGTLPRAASSDVEQEALKSVTDPKEEIMASGDKKHFGRGTQGKGTGAGAMTDLPKDKVGGNAVLSNRDKKQHSEERGLDGNRIKSDQYQDHAANQLPKD